MTLGRLIELYQAEQQGKQIMMTTSHYGDSFYEYITKVKISECELKDLVRDEPENESFAYFIQDEEDKYGCKINK